MSKGANFDDLSPEVQAKVAKAAKIKTPREVKIGAAARVLITVNESGLAIVEQIRVLEQVLKWLRGSK